MKLGVLNIICAHPVAISWVLGACALNAIIVAFFSDEIRAISFDWEVSLLLAFAFVASSLLGYFVGMFTAWPIVRRLCSRFNGSPYKPGDHAIILSGPLKGTAAIVVKITLGQGGWDVVWLDLGPEHTKTSAISLRLFPF